MGRHKIHTAEFIEKEAIELVKWFKADEKRYWLKDFAIKRNYPSENFSRWANDNDKFNHAYKISKKIK